MDVFAQSEYYPTPNGTVIRYKEDTEHKGRKRVLSADLPALIAYLSSPIESIDYTIVSDFFLIYRNFISPMQLYDLLILRYRWCTNEIINSSSEEPQKKKAIGKVSLVRTFVLLRHWTLNYFLQDFLYNTGLRLVFIRFLNEDISAYPKIIKSSIVTLKKAWIANSKLIWDNIDFKEPSSGNWESWVNFKIYDVTQLEKSEKRRSRLSLYALQNTSSPNLRNQSILSLYMSSDNFLLPSSTVSGHKQLPPKTGSMILFPNNTIQDKPLHMNLVGKKNNTTQNSNGGNTAKNNFSSIKDVEYPRSSELDNILPPTPAKKIEFILKSPYIPEAMENKKGERATKEPMRSLSGNSFTSITLHNNPGPLALLAKWKKNHNRNNNSISSSESASQPSGNPEMDKFVQYVVSITSLENKNGHQDIMLDSLSSKFDILSARSIDEVEYLLAIENYLLKRANKLSSPNVPGTASNGTKVNGYSTVDNLNLYKTVSSIAGSVISLTRSLHSKHHISTSFHPSNRRLVKSTTDYLERTNINCGRHSPTDHSNAPQRLVFREESQNIEDDFNASNQIVNFTEQKDSGSPLKNVLSQYSTNSENTKSLSNRTISTISYDSILSRKKNGNDKQMIRENLLPSDEPALRKKVAQKNLREFTFEEGKLIKSELNDARSLHSSSSDASIVPSSANTPVHTMIRPSSGRISLLPRHKTPRRSILSSAHKPIQEDPSYIQRDEILTKGDQELVQLENELPMRFSITPTIETDQLFTTHQSLVTKTPAQKNNTVILSKTPSFRSIHSINSFTTIPSNNTLEPIAPSPSTRKPDLNFQNGSSSHSSISAEIDMKKDSKTANKYLFSPDTDSMDNASPAKDLEELKNKFLRKDSLGSIIASEEEENDMEQDLAEDDYDDPDLKTSACDLANTDILKNDRNSLTVPSDIAAIANLPDDSMHDDPLAVALMKLEGKYAKEKKTPTASQLSLNSNILKLDNLPSISRKPIEKRRSLFIEHRRQTLMEIPYTPNKHPSIVNQLLEPNDSYLGKAYELLSNYEVSDRQLQIENSDQHVSFILMYSSISIAQQLTLIEKELLMEIDWKDLLDLNIRQQIPEVTSWLQLLVQNETISSIDLAIARFNLTVNWIISEIILTKDVKLKRNTIQRFIHVAEHCCKLQNYNTLMQIVLALGSAAVQKFSNAWRLIEPGDMLTWEELKRIPSLDNNYQTIRTLLNGVDPINGCVPFIVVYLSDLSLNNEKRDWIVDNQVVNYNKFDTNVQIVKNFIQRVQWGKFYAFATEEELLSKCVYISALKESEIQAFIQQQQ